MACRWLLHLQAQVGASDGIYVVPRGQAWPNTDRTHAETLPMPPPGRSSGSTTQGKGHSTSSQASKFLRP